MFRVLHAISSAMGNTVGKSCVFHNVIGALMTAKHYMPDARPVTGAAFVRVHDPSQSVLTCARIDGTDIASDPDAFHCWVEAGGYAIDFTAPTYKEALEGAGNMQAIPRKMFQRPLTSMATSLDELQKEGDFLLVPDHDLSEALIQRFMSKHAPTDLANVCLSWFKKPLTKTPAEMSMINDLGEETRMRLPSIFVPSCW